MTHPLYKTVCDTVIERITSGSLMPGAMLPSETDLGAELGVSQGTARKALIELERRGIVMRKQGRGTFVTTHMPESARFPFYCLRDANDMQVSTKLERETIVQRQAKAEEKNNLFGAPDQVFDIIRTRSIEGRRLICVNSVVPTDLFPGLMDRGPLKHTLYVFFQQAYACVIVRADEKIRAGIAGLFVAEALDIAADTPVLEIERLSYDLADRVVERRITTFVTDVYTYNMSLS